MTTFVCDGSFDGLMTALFDFYQLRPGPVKVVPKAVFEPTLLGSEHEVVTDEAKASRVWEGLRKKLDTTWLQRMHYAFLSESPVAYQQLFDFARYIFDHAEGASANFGNESVRAVQQWAQMVSRERHRMKAFIRFQETMEGTFYAPVEPDFNVLPLIATFFRDRYADQKWIIYDIRRKYGLYYDLETVTQVTFEETPQVSPTSDVLSDKEDLFGLMWKDYFKSTNIPARRNLKLHIRHVPKRYWKYLTEKR
ncbi:MULTISPECIES: TIGR03915 family putative DNA repair protein [unclassified Flavobacterium]|uniref:TIGR03915 family putative DNA repair protein n=1 Tax=unclassified Flavobacterium TaxID=196869 RepID=UPI001F12B625|nr:MULTISPECIES: TIGR03915 family putative DNA repair protein [unclassified Flavobacterium]UMY66149.1 TIGR03915 family putative DNA repair protein [Flavobacterium sp. HJ-32-4]